jgi:hypothetical protein
MGAEPKQAADGVTKTRQHTGRNRSNGCPCFHHSKGAELLIALAAALPLEKGLGHNPGQARGQLMANLQKLSKTTLMPWV